MAFRRILFTALLGMFILAGCDTAVTGTEEAVPVDLPLDQNYTVQLANGSISIDYPVAWAVSAEFPELGIVIATSEDLASQTSIDTLADEQVYINILFNLESALNDGATPSIVLQELVDSVENPDGTVSEIQASTLNGKVAAYVTLDAEDSADGIQLVIDSGDAYSTVLVAVPDGDIETYLPTVEALAGSIEYILNVEAEATEPASETTETSD